MGWFTNQFCSRMSAFRGKNMSINLTFRLNELQAYSCPFHDRGNRYKEPNQL